MTPQNLPTHNGETARKAAAWDWVQRVGAAGVWPLALGLIGYIAFHERNHERINGFMAAGDRWTAKQAHDQEEQLKSWVEARLYPEWIREELRVIKGQLTSSNTISLQNQADIRAILRELDKNK